MRRNLWMVKSMYERFRYFNQTIKAVAAMLEIRDLYALNHQLRVAKIARIIAEEMNLSEDKISFGLEPDSY